VPFTTRTTSNLNGTSIKTPITVARAAQMLFVELQEGEVYTVEEAQGRSLLSVIAKLLTALLVKNNYSPTCIVRVLESVDG
jgi:hypothetical protein